MQPLVMGSCGGMCVVYDRYEVHAKMKLEVLVGLFVGDLVMAKLELIVPEFVYASY